MMFVRSPSGTSMIARTREFEEIMEKRFSEYETDSDADRQSLFTSEIQESYEAVYLSKEAAGLSTAERTELATRAAVRKYKLGYYKGAGTSLQRVPDAR